MTPLDPPSALPLTDARRAAMHRQLSMMVTRHRPRRPRRPLLVVGTGVAVAIGTSAGAYAYVQHSVPVTDKTSARCYTADNTSGGGYVTIGEPPGGGGKGPIDDALAACAAFWRQGIVRPGATAPVPPGPANKAYPVPPLVACVMPDGTAAVFPGQPGTCAALGFPDEKGR